MRSRAAAAGWITLPPREFGAMQQLTVSAELVIIRQCRYSGYKMVNLV